jgi:hypothetical protein
MMEVNMLKKAIRAIALVFVLVTFAYADVGILATSNGIQDIACDGTTDDAANMQTLINGLQALATPTTGADYGKRTYITFPANSTCKFNSGWTINGEKLGLAGDGTNFDFSGMPTAGATATATIGTGNGTTTQFASGAGLPIMAGTTTVTAGAVTGTSSGTISNAGGEAITGTGITSGVNSQVGNYYGNIAVLYATPVGNATPVTAAYKTYVPAVTITTTSSPYGAGASLFRGIHMLGPGQNSPTIGLLLNGANLNIDKPIIHDFGIDVSTENNAYLLKMTNPTLYNAQVDYNEGGFANSGEENTIQGGQLFNSGHGVVYSGEMVVNSASLDFMSGTFIEGGGTFKGYGLHIEGAATNNISMLENGSCNAFGFMELREATVLIDGSPSTTEALAQVDGSGGGQYYITGCNGNGHGGWIRIQDSFINGMNASGLSCAFGSSPLDCVQGSSTYVNNMHNPVAIMCDNTTGSGGGYLNNLSDVGWCR